MDIWAPIASLATAGAAFMTYSYTKGREQRRNGIKVTWSQDDRQLVKDEFRNLHLSIDTLASKLEPVIQEAQVASRERLEKAAEERGYQKRIEEERKG